MTTSQARPIVQPDVQSDVQPIDLRSDTVTRPTAAVRAAMAAAEVGDDVYGDDPTVAKLEATVADLLGKEAGVFVPSGTMSNQIALRVHCQPGDWILAPQAAHILTVEAASTAGLAGLTALTLPAPDGRIDPADVATTQPVRHASVKLFDWYRPKLLCAENTHNAAGGTCTPAADLAAACAAARELGMACHLDGARLWNAATALRTSLATLAAPFDTISVCFSKGLGAPVGSMLVGGQAMIDEARRFRAHYGGGMRQVGILAAGALCALETNYDRLEQDHLNAKSLATGLAALPGVTVDVANVETNIVKLTTALPAPQFCDLADSVGVLMIPLGQHYVRAVTSYEVDAAAIENTLVRLAAALA